MTNNILVGLTIGARLASNFRGAMSQTTSALAGLKRSGTDLRAEHQRMGQALAKSISEPVPRVRELRAEYDRLGGALQRLEMRNKSLAGSMRATQALSNQRADLRGEMMGTAISGAVAAAPILASISIAAGFQEKMRDTRITGGMSAGEESELSGVARQSAKKFNQTQDEVANGISVLVAGGISNVAQLKAYTPVMAKAAAATKSSMDDVGATAIAMSNSLQIGAKDFESSFTMLAYAGKKGQFEVRDMAKWLPNLAPQFAALGITGKRAVAEIGASLQVARMGAGSNDEAANNFRNFLGKITAPDTLKDFAKAGIDLKGSLQNLVSKGMTPTQAMLEVIGNYMTTKGPEAAQEFKRVMSVKDDAERQAAMDRLNEAHKLGELFQDMQAMNFIRPAIQNADKLKEIQQGAMGAGDSGLLDADLKLRMDTAAEQGKRFKIAMSEIALTLGGTLLPAVNSLVEGVMPLLQGFEKFAAANPGVIKGVLGVGAALFGGKMAVLGLRYGLNLLISPFAAARQAKDGFMTGWSVFQSMRAAGQFAPLAGGIGRIAKVGLGLGGSLKTGASVAMGALRGLSSMTGLWSIGGLLSRGVLMGVRSLGMLGRGALGAMHFMRLFSGGMMMAFGAPLRLAAGGIWHLTKLLGGGLVSGLRLAGHALMFVGRAMLMNPIGLAVTGLALAGLLIYRNWDRVGPYFRRAWAGIKSFFSGGLAAVSARIVNWSPLGLFYKAFAGVMSWFGVKLPANFTDFGSMLVKGLIDGITSKIGAAKAGILKLGGDIKGWFASTLGIKSPSRVFMGFGDNIAQGAALGIDKGRGRAGAAAAGLALATTMAWAKPVLPAPSAQPLPALTQRVVQQLRRPDALPQEALAARVMKARDAGGDLGESSIKPGRAKPAGGTQRAMSITYSPQITVAATAPQGVREQVSEALRLSQAEFERMLKRSEADRRRRSYETD